VDVYEFGNRNLREGCFGEDVLQLQNWLADETYYNPVDGGYTGYFGSVTKEALQAWQRDNGLEATGHFDSASKSTYLRSLEMRTAEAAQVASSFVQGAVRAIPTAQSTVVGTSSTASGTPFFAAAAVLAGIAFARLATPVLRRATSTVINVFTSKAEAVSTAEYNNAVATPTAATISDAAEHYYEQQGEEIYETASQQKVDRPSRLRRLSDEELQRYIAPFKGASATGNKKSSTIVGRPTPQRPIPRRSLNLNTSTNTKQTPAPAAVQAPVTSRHGTYYGGKQVLDRVKEYLVEEGSMPAAPGAVGQRMQKLGYNMRPNNTDNNTNNNNNSNTSGGSGSRPRTIAEAQREYQRAEKIVSPLQMMNNNTGYSTTSSFEDIPEAEFAGGGVATAVAVASRERMTPSKALLTGTELEAMPESPLRPVPVKRGSNSTRKAPVGATTTATATSVKPVRKAAPRPVAVVKPSRADDQEVAAAAPVVQQAPVDPNSAVVLTNKPVKLHKPARLANRSVNYSSMSDEE
jgi:peptidoglycan hydrolase-like protein with peptidoglycan-binding domain